MVANLNTITNYYGISTPVEFLDILVDEDSRLFIDPSRIRTRQASDSYARQAYGLLTSFFDEVLRCLNSSTAVDRFEGERILQQFTEPNETRLGMSKNGVHGHGAAAELGSAIWNEMLSSQLCRYDIAVLKHVEHIPIFVDKIDVDITSDLTTRIILPALARFTADMVSKYSNFSAKPHVHVSTEYSIWDTAALDWQVSSLMLPEAAHKPLALIPQTWAGPRLLMNHGQYYQVVVLDQIRDEFTTFDSKGKRHRPYKKDLKLRAEYKQSRPTSIVQTKRVFSKDKTDLVDRYQQRADDKARPLSDQEVLRYLGPK